MNRPAMSWLTRGDMALSAPYRIIRTIRGSYELWIFSKTQSGCIGRQMSSLNEAKTLAERHAQKQKETA